jgi:HlyD family secretion protein
MKSKLLFIIQFLSILLIACNGNGRKADAYGNFETDELTVSSEAGGRIIWLTVEEGQVVDSAHIVGLIDTTQIALRRKQVVAQVAAASSRIPNITAQANVQIEQIKILEVERNRLVKLLADGAATQKQMDDVEGKIALAKKQIEAINSQRLSVESEIEVLKTQLVQLIDQQAKCKIINPVTGTVLSRFSQQGEVVPMGKPIYKLANIDYLYLKVFVSGNQLHQFAMGDEVKVYIDGDDDTMIETSGVVSWVSSNAEFTPKIIQTREERVKMVYAVKIKVKNNGQLKIGMPGEVIF